MEARIMIDALKRGSAKRISVVLPFYPYARQDKKHRGREPISARLIADLMKTAGADRIITVDLHTDQIRASSTARSTTCTRRPARRVCPRAVRHRQHLRRLPDSGRVRVAEKWADSLNGAPLAFIHKTRDPLVPNQVKSNRVVGDVEGRTCVLIDDMIDTGGTIAGAVKVLKDAGAGDVIIATTHGVFSDPAAERPWPTAAPRRSSRPTRCRSARRKQFANLTVLSIAPLLAQTIREVFENGSVTSLFNGSAWDRTHGDHLSQPALHDVAQSVGQTARRRGRADGREVPRRGVDARSARRTVRRGRVTPAQAARKREPLYRSWAWPTPPTTKSSMRWSPTRYWWSARSSLPTRGARLARPLESIDEIL